MSKSGTNALEQEYIHKAINLFSGSEKDSAIKPIIDTIGNISGQIFNTLRDGGRDRPKGYFSDLADYYIDEVSQNPVIVSKFSILIVEFIEKKVQLLTPPENEKIEKCTSINTNELNLKFRIMSLFDNGLSIHILSFINDMIEKVDTLVTGNLSRNDKIKNFAGILTILNTSFFNNNAEAVNLLRELLILRFNEYLNGPNQNSLIMYSIPKKCYFNVMGMLNGIVEKYIQENKSPHDNVSKVHEIAKIKEKCNFFIKELDSMLVELYTLIYENKDFNYFKKSKITNILVQLEIPSFLHNDFYRIAYLYFLEGKKSILGKPIF